MSLFKGDTLIAGAGLPNVIVDNLTTADSTKALSAKQGKVLNESINEIETEVNRLKALKALRSNDTGAYSIAGSSWTVMNTTSFANAPLGYCLLMVFCHIESGVTTTYEFTNMSGMSTVLSVFPTRCGGEASTGNTNHLFILPVLITSSSPSFTHRIYSNGATASNGRQTFLIPLNME